MRAHWRFALPIVVAVAVGGCGGRARSPADARGGGACGDGRPTLVVQEAHPRLVTDVALSADGGVLVSAGAESILRVWDTRTGLLLRRVPTRGPAETLALSATGDVVAYSVTTRGTEITVVDLASQAEPVTFDPGGAAHALSPDGTLLVKTLPGARIGVFDAKTGDSIDTLGIGPAAAIAFHPSGKVFGVSRQSDVAIVDVATRKVVRELLHGGSAPFHLWLAGDVAIVQERGLTLLPLAGGAAAPVAMQLPAVDVAAAGKRAFVTTGPQLFTLDLGTRAVTPVSLDDLGTPHRVSISDDGSTLAVVSMASGGADGNAIRLRDASTLQPLRSMEGRSTGVAAIAVRPDGAEMIAVAKSGSITRWDLTTGTMLGLAQGQPLVGFSANVVFDDKAEVVSATGASGAVRILDRNLRPLRKVETGEPALAYGGFSGKGQTVITAGMTGIRRWDPSASAAPAASPQPVPIKLAQPSPDGSRIAFYDGLGVGVAGLDGTRRWHTNVWVAGLGGAWLGWSSDGSRVMISSTQRYSGTSTRERPTLRIFDASDGSLDETVEIETQGPISPRGALVAIGGQKPAIVQMPDGDVKIRLEAQDQDVTSIAWHPRGDRVYLGGDGGTISVVSASTGRLFAILAATSNGEFVAATPRGAFHASIDGARSVGWAFSCPLEGFPFQQFASKFERPDLVARALGGADVPPPAELRRPPSVRVNAAPAETAERSIQVKASVVSGGTVEKLRVFVNGRSAVERGVGAPKGDVDLDVPLTVGRNRLSVIAYDAEGLASNARVLDVVSTAKGAAPDLWIVSLGVSKYPKLAPEQQLEFADDDARSIAESFGRQAGPGRPFSRLHALTLVDRQVTVQAAERAIAGLAAMKPDDFAVVFLAGHGIRLSDGSVFLTSEAGPTAEGARAGGVGWAKLRAALEKARGRVLVLLDACHSGHVSTETVTPNEALAKELVGGDRAGVLVFAASRGSQLSYEVSGGSGARGLELAWGGQRPPPSVFPMPPPSPAAPTASASAPKGDGHGLFTTAVLEALSGSAPDRDKSRAIEVDEFVGYVTERVRAASNGAQTPWVARQELFGDFVVAPAR